MKRTRSGGDIDQGKGKEDLRERSQEVVLGKLGSGIAQVRLSCSFSWSHRLGKSDFRGFYVLGSRRN